MIRRSLAILLTVTALGACKAQPDGTTNSAAPAPVASAASPTEDAVAAIKAVEADMAAAYAARDVDRVVRHYADDAHAMTGSDTLQGRDAIKKQIAIYMALPKFSNTYDAERVYAAGDLGYVRGHYRTVAGNGQKTLTSDGAYVTVYRKQRDGSWQVIDDITTETTPAAK